MAINDPTYGVPTPTGTLQGLAAFSWDGSAWQPVGRPSASVGTPTGVLRGVAPFTWSGSAWTPAGGGPDVATPTGVLDGVAVYTWSGSAWTPAGGGPDVATPTGVLQGVAAFNWDGTAWQPSGQAGPDVATPNGVLQGVAMFSWAGSAWTPAVVGTALDINFLNTTALDARVTFTRASIGTYFDANGVMQTAAANGPRFDYDPVTHVSRGLLIEESRTNLLLNSATLGTQSVTTTATATTLSFYGTGSVTLSGTSSGTTNGTGAATRVVTTFTPTAGTLTLTVTGSVTNAQLEAGGFVTSYIPTAGSTVTRQADTATIASIPGRNATAETFAAEYMYPTAQNGACRIIGSATSGNAPLYSAGATGATGEYDGVGILGASTVNAVGIISKAASTWTSPSNATICLNAGTVASSTSLTAGFASTTSFKLMGDNSAGDQANGYIRRFRYWPRALSNTELQQVTT